MRARAEWREQHICPECGFPKEFCQDPKTEWLLNDPERVRCHITTRLRRAQKAYADLPNSEPAGLLWIPTFKTEGQ